MLFLAARPTPTNSATNSLEKQLRRLHKDDTETVDGSSSYSSLTPEQQQLAGGPQKPFLSEDYAEIGLGEEEGDYSTPAARNYELDRSQIVLNEIIGHGQFGDVHIGTCRIKQHKQSENGGNHSGDKTDELSSSTSSLINESENGEGSGENGDIKTGTIHVAVKTCKADADITTSEKFLEEACKNNKKTTIYKFILYFCVLSP